MRGNARTTMQRDMSTARHDTPQDELADPAWFRPPSRREHWIAAALFVGFGVFFGLLFVVNRGWWFGWVILGLAAWSVAHGARHALDARRQDDGDVGGSR